MYPPTLQTSELAWTAQEVIREVDHRPHLLVRIAVTGGPFPQRAAVPVMRIVHGEEMVHSWFTEISADSRTLFGYFATDLPDGGTLEVGYYDEPLRRVPAGFDAQAIRRLDRRRLDREVVETTQEYVRQKRGF